MKVKDKEKRRRGAGDAAIARPDHDALAAIHEVRDQLLRRADDLESAVYDLQALYAVGQASGSDASKRIAYLQQVSRLRQAVRDTIPRDATVLVVSKGDPDLLRLHGRRGWHFPQTDAGVYAGAYPHSSAAAIAHLEVLRARGAEYLVFPQIAMWWLDHYGEFTQHLTRRYQKVTDIKDVCQIFSLAARPASSDNQVWDVLQGLIAEFQDRFHRAPSILDWNSGLDLAGGLPGHAIFGPPAKGTSLPYMDSSIDITVLSSAATTTLAEARRVSHAATVTVRGDQDAAGARLAVDWKQNGSTPHPVRTSIVIPCHNGAALTKACLTSLLETLPRTFQGEIIAVDDASTDGTGAALEALARIDSRVKVLRNDKNLGFILSCNRGAKAAAGDVLLFLNNDTVLLPGWLPPLLRVFQDDPKAGVVGGKLMFADGRLQEAGGLIFRDGSAAHFGRGDQDVNGFLYQFVREVDYCSGALLATRRSLFHQLKGFDPGYCPAYYEDVDYCFKVRKKGFRVYYQPESVIVHVEGASCGVDLSRGTKRYQVINQRKFAEKWKQALRNQPLRPNQADTAAWQALAVSRRNGTPA